MVSFFYGKKRIYKDLRSSLKIDKQSEKRGENEKKLIANIMLFAKSPRFDSYAKIKKYEKEWFNETVMLPFDDMEMPCPKDYNSFLTTQYGDWQIPVRDASMHNGVYTDVNHSYREIIAERLKKIPKWKRFFYKH